jgi:hypothetical protein
MSEDEFYAVMEKHRCPQLQDIELSIKPKDRPNAERLLPFAEQVIEEQQEM